MFLCMCECHLVKQFPNQEHCLDEGRAIGIGMMEDVGLD